MSEEMINLIPGIVGILVFIFCYFRLILFGKSRKQKFVEKAKENGNFVEGVFVDFRISRGSHESKNDAFGEDDYIVKYEYCVDGMKYYKKLRFNSGGSMTKCYPSKIMVYYNPNNPKKAIAGNEATAVQQKKSGCLTSFVVTGIVVWSLIRLIRLF